MPLAAIEAEFQGLGEVTRLPDARRSLRAGRRSSPRCSPVIGTLDVRSEPGSPPLSGPLPHWCAIHAGGPSWLKPGMRSPSSRRTVARRLRRTPRRCSSRGAGATTRSHAVRSRRSRSAQRRGLLAQRRGQRDDIGAKAAWASWVDQQRALSVARDWEAQERDPRPLSSDSP